MSKSVRRGAGCSLQNYTTNPYRRVDLKAQIARSVNPL